MAKRAALRRLQDILNAIDEAAEHLDGGDFGFYERNAVTRRAVERCNEIISEASRHIPIELQQRRPDIPWEGIRAIGNKLRHEYWKTADFVIWKTAARHLVELRQAIQALHSEEQSTP